MKLRTQVVIIGGGPSGLLLSQILHRQGIASLVLERRDRAYVEGRIRAGVLERGSVAMLREAGCGARLDREGLIHKGIYLSLDGRREQLDFDDLTGGSHVVVYGQTEVTKDLIAARLAAGGDLRFECADVALHDLTDARPRVTWTDTSGETHEAVCDVVAGCDGFHGVSRQSIPRDKLDIFERIYPFGWLGILAESPPVADELIYARHERGFALYSMRSPTIVRHYIQCAQNADVKDWPDARIWDELRLRLLPHDRDLLREGPIFEKSVTPMRSFVCEPMRYGRLFLAGDAAHIVPPTGAKGLNLAIGDVHYLSGALIDFCRRGDMAGLDAYSGRALARVWKAQRFSWWMTSILHNWGDARDFDNRIRDAEMSYVLSSRAAQVSLAENYVGLPY